MPSSTGTLGEEQQRRCVQGDAGADGGVVAGPVDLLQQAGRDDEGRPEHHHVEPPRAAALPEAPVAGNARGGLGDRAPAAGRREAERQREAEAREQHDELHRVHPGCRAQAPGGEVDRHDDTADEAAGAKVEPGDGAEDAGHADDLPREDRQRGDPEQRGDGDAYRLAVAELQIVADGAQIVPRRDAPHGGSDPESEHERSDAGRADPPPDAEPVAVGEPRRADGGAGPDVGGQQRGEEQEGAEATAGDEEVGRVAAPAGRSRPPGPSGRPRRSAGSSGVASRSAPSRWPDGVRGPMVISCRADNHRCGRPGRHSEIDARCSRAVRGAAD